MEGVEGEVVVGKVSAGYEEISSRAGGRLDRNFSRAEAMSMLVYREVTSMVTSRILEGRGWGRSGGWRGSG